MESFLPIDQTSKANKAKIYDFIHEQNIEELDALFTSEKIFPHEEITKESGWTAFHWACHSDKKASLEFLLKYTYKHYKNDLAKIIQVANSNGRNPLMVATEFGAKECFNLFFEAGGVDLDLKDNEGLTVKDLAIKYGYKNFEEKINSQNASLVPINHEFFSAALYQEEEEESKIVEAETTSQMNVLVDKIKPCRTLESSISSEALASIAALRLSKFRQLVEDNNIEPNEDLSPGLGWTAFHYAALHNAPKIVEYLIKRTFHKYKAVGLIKYLNVENNEGQTPLHICCLYKAVDALKIFYQYGGVNPATKDDSKYDAMMYSKYNKNKECEEVILSRPQDKILPLNEKLFSEVKNNTRSIYESVQESALDNVSIAGSFALSQKGIEMKVVGDQEQGSGGQPTILSSLKLQIEEGFKRLRLKSLTTEFSVIKTIAVTKNGRNVSIGGTGSTILNIDTQMNTILKIDCHQSDVNALAVGDDNNTIVSASKDGCIVGYNIPDQRTIYQIKSAHNCITLSPPILALAITLDLKLSYSGDSSGVTKVYNLETRQQVAELDFHDGASVRAVAVSSNKKFAVSGGDDLALVIINFEDFTLTKKQRLFHNDVINGLKITDDSRLIISCSADGTIGFFNLETLKLEKSLTTAHTGSINSIALTDDSRFLFSGSSDSSVGIIDMRTQDVIYNFRQNLKRLDVSAVGVSGNGRYLAVGTKTSNLELFDLYEGAATRHYEAHRTGVSSLYITSNKQYAFAGAKDGSIAVIYLPSNEIIENKRIHNGPVTSITMVPDEEFLVSASGDTTLCISVLKNERLEIRDKISGLHSAGISSIQITSDGRYLISADEQGLISVTDLKTNLKLFGFNNSELDIPTQGTIKALKLSSDNNVFYAGSMDSKVVKYSLADRKMIEIINYEISHKIMSLALSQDEQRIFTGAADGSVHVYDQMKGEVIRCINKLHKNAITKIVISSDGRYLFTSSRDSSVGIIDADLLKPISRLKGIHKGAIQTLAISSDNKFLLTGGDDTQVSRVQNFIYNDYCLIDSIGNQLELPVAFREMLFVKMLEPNKNSQIKTLAQYPRLTVYPNRWNWLHIFSMVEDSSDGLITECIKLQVPFITDFQGKTSLHYLLNAPKLDGTKIDLILANFGKLVRRKYLHDQIFVSLKDIFLQILKLDNPKVALFLKECVNYPPTYKNELIPRFGGLKVKGDLTHCCFTSPTPLFTGEVKNQLLDVGGANLLIIYFLRIPCDFRGGSKEFLELVRTLEKCTNEDIFQTRAVSTLIDKAWELARLQIKITSLTYSINMVVLCTYILNARAVNFGPEPLGISLSAVTFIFGLLAIFSEARIMIEEGVREYFSEYMNWSNLLGSGLQCLLPIAVGSRVLLSDETKRSATLELLFSFCILLRFYRWSMLFRIFDSTRNFIKMLSEVILDMAGFAVVTTFVLGGFSIIFYIIFDVDQTDSDQSNQRFIVLFFQQMFNVYAFLIGTYDSSGYQGIQIFFFIILTIFISLVLLNILIAHMGATYERVQQQSIFYESKDKLSLIKEAFTETRARLYLRCRREALDRVVESNYLFCAKEGIEDLDQLPEDGEGLNLLRRDLLLKLNEIDQKIAKVHTSSPSQVQPH